jgi:hypothetical protein
MTTLILRKECKGYYSNKVGSFEIAVSKCNNCWTGSIVNHENTNDNFQIYLCYGQTKSIVSNQLIKYLQTNKV